MFLGAVALLFDRLAAARHPGLPLVGEREDVSGGLVVLFGIAIPIVALVALFAVSDVYLVSQSSPPDPRSTAMTIDVIGQQWWWEVRYPGTQAVTANEIHIPTGTRVNVVATTADVIHSFWVPELNRKIDMIPGIPEPGPAVRAPRRVLSRPVLAVLRAPARAHVAVRVRAAARRSSTPGSRTWPPRPGIR